MKQRVALSVFCAAAAWQGGAAVAVSSTALAESQASAWLRARRNAPQQDELAELKAENPTAYAIVKALLTKRSLGLLDPKHPSPSFSAPPPQSSEDAGASTPQGAEAFEKIAEESGEKPKAALAYPDAPVATAHHDWMNWKPSQSAMDDDAMVKNVLGAVAELKAGKGGSTNLRGQAPVDAEGGDAGDALQWKDIAAAAPAATAAPPAAPAAPVAAEAKPQAAMSQENSYLKGIDFGLDQPAVQPRRQQGSQENSYLKGFDFGSAPEAPAAAPAAPQLALRASKSAADSHDFLAGFSWDDNTPRAAAAAPPPRQEPAAAADAAPAATAEKAAGEKPSSSSGGGALLAWLGGGKPAAAAPAPTSAKAAPAAPQNSYMMDLQ